MDKRISYRKTVLNSFGDKLKKLKTDFDMCFY